MADYELVEAGVAFAIFAFIPLCQIYGSHATVDIFTIVAARRVKRRSSRMLARSACGCADPDQLAPLRRGGAQQCEW